MKKQKVINRKCGNLHTFLHSPGSYESLAEYISNGWVLVFSQCNDERGVFVLEREEPDYEARIKEESVTDAIGEYEVNEDQ